jgi:type III pantothenate kinase
MSTTICFDFGNTRYKAAVFHEDQLQEVVVLVNDEHNTMLELINKYKPAYTILSSVVNHQPVVEDVLKANSNFHKLSHHTKLPFTTPVGKPETIGADRLALCAAATYLFPNKNNLAIALGTCITLNFINTQNQFLGGSISPGLQMRLQSMHALTAKLPLVNMEWNFPLIGYDTKTNLLSGAAWGMAKEIDGIIDAYRDKFGNFNVLLTGGDTPHFAPLLKNMIFADPQLIFKGLYAISVYNR